jgi:hypothetical protein
MRKRLCRKKHGGISCFIVFVVTARRPMGAGTPVAQTCTARVRPASPLQVNKSNSAETEFRDSPCPYQRFENWLSRGDGMGGGG